MMRREMRARRRLGANSRSTDVVVTPWADEYVPAPCADLPTYPPCHAGAGGRTYLPTPPLISQVGLPTMKKHKTQSEHDSRCPRAHQKYSRDAPKRANLSLDGWRAHRGENRSYIYLISRARLERG